MGIDRIRPSSLDLVHGPDNRQLAESVVEMVVTANDMRHAHIVIVDNDGEHVRWRAVGAQEDVIVNFGVLDGDLTLHLVMDHGFAFCRNLEPDDERSAVRCVTLVAITPASVIAHRLLVRALLGTHFFELFWRCEALVGVACVEQLPRYLRVALGTIGLENRRFVKIQAEPVEPFDDLVDRVLRAPLAVRVLDPQERPAAVVPGE